MTSKSRKKSEKDTCEKLEGDGTFKVHGRK